MTFQGYMRATVFTAKRATYPAFVQPKHNGIRCLWDGETAWTREGNLHAEHIQQMLQRQLESGVPARGPWQLDGELVLPREKFSFQQTQSAVAAENENSHLLNYVVFDALNPESFPSALFAARMLHGGITCETHLVCGIDEVEHWYEDFLARGYEGLIFRTDTPYLFGSGARHLMKITPTQKAEFLCLGVWEGTGKDMGTPVYRLARPDVPLPGVDQLPEATAKNSFGARPKGDYPKRRELWKQRGSVIGKMYTVEFREFYTSGVPQFPVGIGVRDYE